MFKDVDELRAQIRAFKLQRLEEKIVSLAKPAIFMKRTKVLQHSFPPGASRLGGLPDLPADFQWQYFEGRPLTFIGQFKLSEIVPHDADGILPQHGILYFFFEADDVPWGELEHQGAWQVFYLEDENTPLVRTPHPTYPGTWRTIDALPVHRVSFEQVLSLPTIHYPDQAKYGIEYINLPGTEQPDPLDHPTEHYAYFDLRHSGYPEPRHFWLGHPSLIQGDVEGDIVSTYLRFPPPKDANPYFYRYTDEQIAQIEMEMKKWQFLFQIDSDDGLDVMWGDVGTLYICIPKTSLAARRFEDCWTIMQCS
jgi:uncharacterized protein YwqG